MAHQSRGRMKHNIRFWTTLIVVALVAMSCDLPFELGEQQAAPTVLAPQPPVSLPTSALPTALPTVAPTIAPTKPQATSTPTQPPVVNLTGINLKLTDLPAGFQELDAASQAQIGLTQENLAQSFQSVFRQAKVSSMTAFINPNITSFEVIVGLVFHPLTTLEQSAFDLEVSDPAKAIATFGQGFGNKTEPLAGADKFGNASLGMTFTTTSGALVLRGDIVIVRRESAAIVLLTMVREGSKPPVSVLTLTPIVDARVKTAFGK